MTNGQVVAKGIASRLGLKPDLELLHVHLVIVAKGIASRLGLKHEFLCMVIALSTGRKGDCISLGIETHPSSREEWP